MKAQVLGDLAGAQATQVFEVENFDDGYGLQISCDASNTPSISVYESLGKYVAGEGMTMPSTSEAQYWAEVASSGVASATEAFVLNRDQFRGKFVYASIGNVSMTNAVVLFNAKK
jgi:hypothetical protein